jgi:hypothetical protein
LWATLFYAVITLVLDIAIDGRWRNLRSPSMVDVLHQMVECRPDGPDVVCLGTSRLGSAFSGDDVLQQMIQLTGKSDLEVFNASNGSQDFITSDFILEQMLARGHAPKLAIVEIAPEMVARHDLWLGSHVMPGPSADNLADYVAGLCRSWMNAPGILSDHLYPMYRCRRQMWMAANYALNLDLPGSEGWHRRSAWSSGADPHGVQVQQRLIVERFLDTDQRKLREARVKDGLRTIRYWLGNYHVGGLVCEALERFLQRCEQHRVHVLLVVPPVGSEQRQLYSRAIEVEFQEYLHGLLERHDCACIDCRAYLPDECFSDNHHVRVPEGSVPFSLRLTREVLVPQWQALQGVQRMARGK